MAEVKGPAQAPGQWKLKVTRLFLPAASVSFAAALHRYCKQAPCPIRVSGSPRGQVDFKVDLNTADCATLDLLPYIGPVTAAAIIRHRSLHGPFKSLRELGSVPGIGPGKTRKISRFAIIKGGD